MEHHVERQSLGKVVYIGHSYHQKTQSTSFLLHYLQEYFDVTIYLDESWAGKPYPDLSFIDQSYVAVIFFQLLPPAGVMENIDHDNIIYIPMYDQSGRLPNSYWKPYKRLRFINFSETLHRKMVRWGLESLFVKYFPEPKPFEPGDMDTLFFWQRLSFIDVKTVTQLIGNQPIRFHLHKAVDPHHTFTEPSAEEEKRYGITYSEWFPSKEELWELVEKKAIYVAPREFEGIGLSFLEAMAMGKAVIAVDNATMNEYIEHGRTGYLFNWRSPQFIDLTNVREIQKNAHHYISEGFQKWESEKHRILDYIMEVPNALSRIEADGDPLVTIVTITYNLVTAKRQETFLQCLKSIQDQSYGNIEHLIIDGNSTDGTLELLQHANGRNTRIISEPDKGLYDAMNKGLTMARGKYIAFLHSDDYYHNKDAVKLSVRALERNAADFSYANFYVLDGLKKTLTLGAIEKFIYTMPIGHPTMFARTDVLRQEGGFDLAYEIAADYDLLIRLLLKDYKSVHVNHCITTYRTGGAGCIKDYSHEIAALYRRNYEVFSGPMTLREARDIMYQQKLPPGFIAGLRDYLETKPIRNISSKEVLDELMASTEERPSPWPSPAKVVAEGTERIPVFLSSDDNYAPFILTTIYSILDHTDAHVDFFVLDGGISSAKRSIILRAISGIPNATLEFLEIDVEEMFQGFPTRLHFKITAYTRYLIPLLKPDLKKVIYSDVDVIFNADIRDLYHESLGPYSFGAVPYSHGYLNPDPTEIDAFHERLGLSDAHRYFESGLLLIDAEAWRREDIPTRLIKRTQACPTEMILTPDQDVLNLEFQKNYMALGNQYIVVPHRSRIMLTAKETRVSVLNPFIVHYAGGNKPWLDPRMDMADYFWKYARRTPFYEQLLMNLSGPSQAAAPVPTPAAIAGHAATEPAPSGRRRYPLLKQGFVDEQGQKYFSVRWIYRHPARAIALVWRQPRKTLGFALRNPRQFFAWK